MRNSAATEPVLIARVDRQIVGFLARLVVIVSARDE
jgi:hypothetical protein